MAHSSSNMTDLQLQAAVNELQFRKSSVTYRSMRHQNTAQRQVILSILHLCNIIIMAIITSTKEVMVLPVSMCWLVGWLAGHLVGWLGSRLVGFLVGWSVCLAQIQVKGLIQELCITYFVFYVFNYPKSKIRFKLKYTPS